jgi:hypothetical protein
MLAQTLRPEVDLEKLRVTESEGLLANLAAQRAKLLLWQDWASGAEQFGVATQISAQVRNLEIVGKLLGQIAQHHVTTHVMISAEYLQLRAALLRALQPFQDARRAVADALHRLETEAAQRPPQRVLEGVAMPSPPTSASEAPHA